MKTISSTEVIRTNSSTDAKTKSSTSAEISGISIST
jgi:hypothetical protein